MSNLNSYNILINRFKAFADGHFLLKNFTYGAITLADLQKFGLYPFMHIVPVDVSYESGVKNFSFDVFFADLPRDEENKAEYQKETLSDLQQIAEDLLGEITNHRVLFGKDVSVISSRLVPFEEEFSNVLTGWNLSITLQIPYNWNACDIPATFNDFIVYNQSTGESAILEFKDSIVREGGEVRLVNDLEFPPASYYYGTDASGNRGWFVFPADEVGLTCETLGACDTIVDIQTNITNLENDVTDLSANVVQVQTDLTTLEESLSPVATSGDYNDLINQPTIPDSTSDLINDSGFITINDIPAQVNSDWNATSGVAQILNKPIIPISTDFIEDAINNGVINKAPSENAVFDALALKFNIPTGATTDYLDGTGTPTPFPTSLPTSVVSHEVKLGSTMTKGTPVYVSSADGTNMIVSPASNTSEATSSKTMGLLMSGGNTNAKVQVITEGLLAGLNTSTATIGDAVWLGSTGTLVYGLANKPVAPLHMVFIGIVTRVNSNNGEIFVKVQNGFEIDELHNVATGQSKTTPIDADAVLLYDSADANGLWKKLSWSNIKATLKTYFDSLYQATLVSGTNIKTIEGQSLLGSGNIDLTKSDVGLSNVDNTSDANKPVSTATQTALNLKQDLLAFTPENVTNKQNSLATDGTGTKYPTIDAVNIISAIDRGRRGFSFFTDFLGNPNSAMDGLLINTSGGSISTTTFIGGRTLSTTGASTYSTGTTTSGFAYHLSNTIAQLFFGGGQMNFETLVSMDTFPTSSENYRTIHGWTSGSGSSNELNGVFFTFDWMATANGTSGGGNWICISVKNGVRTLTTTSVSVNASQFNKLRIEVNASGTSALFYIDGVLRATHTTNIPAYALSQFVFAKNGINKTLGTTARAMYCDYLGFENILTTPR